MRVPGLVLALAWVGFGCAAAVRPSGTFDRWVWIDRWDWRSEADIEQAFDRCQRAGFSAVVFQVRGNGTVCFPSGVESWSEHFGFREPGFDPLAAAVRAAHTRGLRLHAWVNMAPGWVGVADPEDPRQLWNSRRDWFLKQPSGAPPPRAAGRYLALDLCRPEVRAYLVDLCREIVGRYEVDGLHLDYIRHPDPIAGIELGADPAALAAFAAATGARSDDRAALHRWQQDGVTRTVAEVRAALDRSGRRVLLSAAVFADPANALQKVRQDWPAWCRRRLVDAVVPMNYTDDDGRFAELARGAVRAADGVPVVVAIGVHKHRDAAQSQAQIAAVARAGAGIGVFNYRSVFGKSADVSPARQAELQRELGGWLDAAGRRRR